VPAANSAPPRSASRWYPRRRASAVGMALPMFTHRSFDQVRLQLARRTQFFGLVHDLLAQRPDLEFQHELSHRLQRRRPHVSQFRHEFRKDMGWWSRCHGRRLSSAEWEVKQRGNTAPSFPRRPGAFGFRHFPSHYGVSLGLLSPCCFCLAGIPWMDFHFEICCDLRRKNFLVLAAVEMDALS